MEMLFLNKNYRFCMSDVSYTHYKFSCYQLSEAVASLLRQEGIVLQVRHHRRY